MAHGIPLGTKRGNLDLRWLVQCCGVRVECHLPTPPAAEVRFWTAPGKYPWESWAIPFTTCIEWTPSSR